MRLTPSEDCGTLRSMPTLAEEDPEYPSKVAEYCAQHGLKELPWGFILAKGHLVAITSSGQRREHSAALAGVLVVVESDEGDLPTAVEPVPASHPGEGATAVGMEAADGGGVAAPVVVSG